jgi:hypothetical protein
MMHVSWISGRRVDEFLVFRVRFGTLPPPHGHQADGANRPRTSVVRRFRASQHVNDDTAQGWIDFD